MAIHYSLPERRKHHEEMVKRLISNPEARNMANTYIYRQEREEKDRIVNILNQWDDEKYSTTPSSQVINKDAVPHIKEWCSNSSGKELVSVKKFLQHLTNEQEKGAQQDLPKESIESSRQSSRRGSQITQTERPVLRKRETITHGSFYPEPYEGRGNNTGMFNIVRSVPQPKFDKRPTTSGSIAQRQPRKMSGLQRNATQPMMKGRSDYFEIPTNRSGLFGEVIHPVPQSYKENQSPADKPSRPPSNRPSTRGQWGRPSTMQSGRSHSKIPTRGSAIQRSKTQGNMHHKRDSADKYKYSANLQNARDEESRKETPPQQPPRTAPNRDEGVTPRYEYDHGYHPRKTEQDSYEIDVSRNSPPVDHQPLYYVPNDGDSSHRPAEHQNKFPGRRYQASQITF